MYPEMFSTNTLLGKQNKKSNTIVGFKGGGTLLTTPPVRFLSFSCSFRHKSCQLISFHTKLMGRYPHRLGNPGSSTEHTSIFRANHYFKISNIHFMLLLLLSKKLFPLLVKSFYCRLKSEKAATVSPSQDAKTF